MSRFHLPRFVVGLLAIALLPSVVNADPPARRNFRTHLSGDNEVPSLETRAQGQAIFQFSKDGSLLYYKLIVANIEDVFMAHIHFAPEGSNGPVVLWLYPDGPPPIVIPTRSNGVLAEGIVDSEDLVGPLAGMDFDDLALAMELGLTYVNVHTLTIPSGEIRGQID
jgi:hypothetical protein